MSWTGDDNDGTVVDEEVIEVLLPAPGGRLRGGLGGNGGGTLGDVGELTLPLATYD